MNYEQAKAIIKSEAPELIIGLPHSDHIAVKKTNGSVPFCITLPSMARVMEGASAEDIYNAELAAFTDAVQAYKSK